ncbi:50S ribosomal protein L25 [Frankliniella fusca]|uniref:50S ribosomal protein L25 n=1 Tax=Frankliniella fusca TaxID=407009 RepID=A0AAE1LGE9_9NEOP|nr:50S ribosomal protein L25 [Frankliniella fusca]KAK3917764.1 50S ribosomal protein L25 [Frankliniella fusca]
MSDSDDDSVGVADPQQICVTSGGESGENDTPSTSPEPLYVGQISQLYARSDFVEDIQYRFNRVKKNSANLEDIFDGLVYKAAMQEFLSEKFNISFMWNTDGVSLYDSSKLQLWPFYLVINELPPEKRFKRENLILAAVYIGESKPSVNVFLKHVCPLVEQLKQGVSVNVAGEQEPVLIKACIICGTWEKSERTDDVFVHPYEENAQPRTEENYEEDAMLSTVTNSDKAASARTASHGVKGPSYLYIMGIMKQVFFHNFKLLVAGVSLINKQSVSLADIAEAKCLLTQFVLDFEELYGLRHMSFNTHLVLHLPSVVEALGPAFHTSCFGFEDLNGKLRCLIHGSRYAGSQLSSNLFTFLNLPKVINTLEIGRVKEYCTNVHKKMEED